MHLHVFVIRHRVQQPQNMLAGLRIEPVQQHGIRLRQRGHASELSRNETQYNRACLESIRGKPDEALALLTPVGAVHLAIFAIQVCLQLPCLLDLALPPHDNSVKVPLWAGQLTFAPRGYRPASFR